MILTVKKTPRNNLNFRNIIVSLKCRKKKRFKKFFLGNPDKNSIFGKKTVLRFKESTSKGFEYRSRKISLQIDS